MPIETNLETQRRGKRVSWERHDEIVKASVSTVCLSRVVNRAGTQEALIDDYVMPDGSRIRLKTTFAL